MHPSSKRKQRYRDNYPGTAEESSHSQTYGAVEFDPGLLIQGHEATILRDANSAAFARSLEASQAGDPSVKTSLIRWEPSFSVSDSKKAIWVDRYDVRLLLETLPSAGSSTKLVSEPASPTGWSEVPSDIEDAFFLSPEEVEDYHRQKKRRIIEANREKRLKEREEEDEAEEESEATDSWGASDEEPGEEQKELMQRAAKGIVGSSNPTQLEMRILASHGADKRFDFLKGRWRRAWKRIKEGAQRQVESESVEKNESALGSLADYSDSDLDAESVAEAKPQEQPLATTKVDEEEEVFIESIQGETVAERSKRRLRARLWAERRKAVLESSSSTLK